MADRAGRAIDAAASSLPDGVFFELVFFLGAASASDFEADFVEACAEEDDEDVFFFFFLGFLAASLDNCDDDGKLKEH